MNEIIVTSNKVTNHFLGHQLGQGELCNGCKHIYSEMYEDHTEEK
jgi:hypothetical protein